MATLRGVSRTVQHQQTWPSSISYASQPASVRESSPSPPSSNKPHINPSVLVIVIILSIVFICSGILHILARCLGRRRANTPANLNSPSNSIRGQLQHLFTLHDAGVEQVFIDTLPVFLYGSIRGLKDSADCAVCLNEFANEDRLRLLPKCKHAFHLECIDTWLLSNSTCPLCRRSLLPDAEPNPTPATNRCEEHHISSHEEQQQTSHSQRLGSFRGSLRRSFRDSFRFRTESNDPNPHGEMILQQGGVDDETGPPPTPPMTPGGATVCVLEADGREKVMRVELGKVNNIDVTRRGSNVSDGDGDGEPSLRLPRARSYSMGSYEYVVDFSNQQQQLTLQPTPYPGHPQAWGTTSKPSHRHALSDSIPELVSAGQTPAKEDMFWARRGLDTPQSLSKVREILTPSPGRHAFSPLFFESRQASSSSCNTPQEDPRSSDSIPTPSLQQVVMNIDTEEEEEIEAGTSEATLSRNKKGDETKATDIDVMDLHQDLFEEVELTERPFLAMHEEASQERRSDHVIEEVAQISHPNNNRGELSFRHSGLLLQPGAHGAPSTTEEILVAPVRKDKVWEVSVDVSLPPIQREGQGKPSSTKRFSSFNWLRGRGRRLVNPAASPLPESHSQATSKH